MTAQEITNTIQQRLKELEKMLEIAREEISKARAADIDVTELEKRYNDLYTKYLMLKSVYGK